MKGKMSESDDPICKMLVEIFPDATDEERDGHLWSFSPFPFFDPDKKGLANCRKMLQAAADKMKRGEDPMKEFDDAMEDLRKRRLCQETAERLMQAP